MEREWSCKMLLVREFIAVSLSSLGMELLYFEKSTSIKRLTVSTNYEVCSNETYLGIMLKEGIMAVKNSAHRHQDRYPIDAKNFLGS